MGLSLRRAYTDLKRNVPPPCPLLRVSTTIHKCRGREELVASPNERGSVCSLTSFSCSRLAGEGPGLINPLARSISVSSAKYVYVGFLINARESHFQQSQYIKKVICTKDIEGWLLALQKDKLENSFQSQHPWCIGNEIQFGKKKNSIDTQLLRLRCWCKEGPAGTRRWWRRKWTYFLPSRRTEVIVE